jgi:phosphatidylglycerol:prolipoprotein diacylglycerol transferase
VHPVLIDFGSITIGGISVPIRIGSYGLLFGLAVVAAGLWVQRLGREVDPKAPWMDMYFTTIVSGFVGAKLTNLLIVLPDLAAGRASLLGVLQGGGVWLGGVVAGFAACTIAVRRHGLPPGQVVNLAFVAIPFAHAIGRVGCLLGGCCFGSRCSLPWAVTYTDPIAHQVNGTPLGVPLHPTVIYEALAELANFGVCYGLWRRKSAGWTIALTWMGLYGVERFLLEFLRSDPRGAVGSLSTSQWISIAMVGVSVIGALRLRGTSVAPPVAPARRGPARKRG